MAFLLVSACDRATVDEPAAVSFDTLAGGGIHVRNAGTGVWSDTPGARWRVEEELRIGQADGTGPEVFGRVGSVLVDGLDRMWVVDGQANEVRVFDAEGRFVRTVGRRGSGPGEFRRIGPAFHGPQGEIWVEDLALSRWERFDTTGARVGGVRGLPYPDRTRGSMQLWTHDGRLLVVGSDRTAPEAPKLVAYRLVVGDSLVADAFHPFPEVEWPALLAYEPGVRLPVPLSPEPGLRLTPEGEIWVSHRTAEYSIRRQTLEGDTLAVIERAFQPVPAPDSARERAIAELRPNPTLDGAPFRPGDVPRSYPPYEEFHVATDGTLWVLRSLAEGAAGFDVFASDGRYLGQPEVPADLGSMRVRLITASHLYAVATDRLGVDYVVRLAVRRPYNMWIEP